MYSLLSWSELVLAISWFRFFHVGMIFLVVSATELPGLPRFALTSGATCSSCHVNVTGGAMRTEGGWFSIRNVGLIQPRNTFLAPLYGAKSNTLFMKNLRWGFDMRVQVAKRGRDLKRDVFAMQAVPYLSFEVRDNLYVYGSFNFVEPVFPSQQRFTAAVFYRPLEKVAFKAGFIQPKFGIRYDDHTVFTRQQAQLRPMYQELGMELYVTPKDWLTITGGAYSPKNRATESNVPIDESSVMIGGGVDFRPMDWEKGLSYLLSGSFLL
ncbi:MAG: hypothetical protein GXO82_08595, partial [Chlorobi bacterium]|nr:hypothetical protein [Chlorobiota bacterium]